MQWWTRTISCIYLLLAFTHFATNQQPRHNRYFSVVNGKGWNWTNNVYHMGTVLQTAIAQPIATSFPWQFCKSSIFLIQVGFCHQHSIRSLSGIFECKDLHLIRTHLPRIELVLLVYRKVTRHLESNQTKHFAIQHLRLPPTSDIHLPALPLARLWTLVNLNGWCSVSNPYRNCFCRYIWYNSMRTSYFYRLRLLP